jgi:hypothetical protein
MNLNAQELFESSKAKRVYTEADGEQFSQAEKALAEVNFDVQSQHNVALIDEFFQRNRHILVSTETIYRAIRERQSEFTYLTPAQQASRQNPDLAIALQTYLASQGRPGQLVNDDENFLLLFTELQSRRESASTQTIANAENRIANRPGKQLHRVPKPRRTEPISRAAKEDDGTNPFSTAGLVKQADGSYRSKTFAEQKRDAEAAEAAAAAKAATKSTGPSAEDAAWKRMANECLRYGTHGQQAAIKQVFDQAVESGAEWRRVFEACNELVKTYKRAAMTSAVSYR